MKKRICLGFMLILALLMGGGCAALADDALYPIREDGKWGYMNRMGETVIPPQWTDARPFSGGAAVVTVDEEGNIRLIDQTGRPIGEETYDGRWKETPFSYLLLQYGEDGHERWGWYDKQSGHAETCRYIVLQDCVTDCGLILGQWEENGEGKIAFLRRDTGEVVIPIAPEGEIYSSEGFSEGYAYLDIEGEQGWTHLLIDESGKQLELPEGVWPSSAVHDGVLVIAEEEENHGVAKPDGAIVMAPDAVYIDPFSEGRALFCPKDQPYDTVGILDTEGNVIAKPTWTLDGGWYGADGVGFRNGYAVLLTLTDNQASRGEFVILDREGMEVFRTKAHPDDDTTLLLPNSVMENGLIWYRLNQKGEAKYGLLRIREGFTQDLTGPVFDAVGGVSQKDLRGFYDGSLRFSQGLYPVCLDGKWGYIDENGQWALPPVYDAAEHFCGGLAMTESGGKLQYIDRDGAAVWKEN